MDMSLSRDRELHNYIVEKWKKSFNEPNGTLKHKFLDPAASYRGQLWDWDSFFCGFALLDVYEDTAEYVKGCALNFLDFIREDGSIPYVIDTNEEKFSALPACNIEARTEECDFNSIKPLLAQMVLMASSKLCDNEWVKEAYPKLKRHVAHWENTQKKRFGMFVWRSMRGSGIDNHPAVYGRPLDATAAVEVNCFMYKEYLAMAELAKLCGVEADIKIYEDKAKELADIINEHMWDDIDGIYYAQDVLTREYPTATYQIHWDLPLKFKSWTSLMPMWAGIAPKEYAERMVREHITNRDEFWSSFGIRTLAKNEKVYHTTETSNPSNWQGPIWIVSTYLVYQGLVNYGYTDIANEIAENLKNNMYKDFKECGAFHEYYNPETGKSTINKGFMNWNALIERM